MKFRNGHVSNSSSASFTVNKYFISPQISDWIYNPKSALPRLREIYNEQRYEDDDDNFDNWVYNKFGDFDWASDWGVWTNDEGDIKGSCTMDNFNYHEFLEVLNISYQGTSD